MGEDTVEGGGTAENVRAACGGWLDRSIEELLLLSKLLGSQIGVAVLTIVRVFAAA